MAKAPRSWSPPVSRPSNVRGRLTSHSLAPSSTRVGPSRAKHAGAFLSRRAQLGTHPLHRTGFVDHFIDVIAVDALKRTHLESDARGLNAHQHHWTQTLWTDMGPNCYAACVERLLRVT
jgi:hypothetical protein